MTKIVSIKLLYIKLYYFSLIGVDALPFNDKLFTKPALSLENDYAIVSFIYLNHPYARPCGGDMF